MKHSALYFVVAVSVIAAGCASKETKTETPVVERSGNSLAQNPPPDRMKTTPGPGDQFTTGNPLIDPKNVLSKRSVFFDYDSNAVKDQYRDLVQAHSRYMADKRDSKIRIEGNCDERGSREYNLALGQRRAESVKKVMTVLGVSDGRIETTSYGEEKPLGLGHDEQSWSQNRRADIKYSGE